MWRKLLACRFGAETSLGAAGKSACATLALLALAACGRSPREPEPCRNLLPDPAWEHHSAAWNVPPWAKPDGAALVVEGHAEGAISQWVEKTGAMKDLAVVVVGYGRVETAEPVEPADDDITPKLWEGAVAVVNGYSRRFGGMENPHRQLRFTGREIASGAWKRFVTPPLETSRARKLYPHFAFWGVKMAPGVKLRVAGLALVPAPEQVQDLEAWVAVCPSLPAPQPVLVSVTQLQFDQDLEPNGAFDPAFGLRAAGPGELVLGARYHQGPRVADRYLLAVTEDGSDPRLSATSRVQTILARRDPGQWEAAVRVRPGARPVRIAVAAAAWTSAGLRAQTPIFPDAWQRP